MPMKMRITIYKLFLLSQCTGNLLDIKSSFVLRLSRIREAHSQSLGNLMFSCENIFKCQDSQRFENSTWNYVFHLCIHCLQCVQSECTAAIRWPTSAVVVQTSWPPIGSCLFFVFKSCMIMADIQRPGDSDWSGQTRPEHLHFHPPHLQHAAPDWVNWSQVLQESK